METRTVVKTIVPGELLPRGRWYDARCLECQWASAVNATIYQDTIETIAENHVRSASHTVVIERVEG